MSRQLVHGRTRGGGVGSAFEHLQSILSFRSSTKPPSNCSIQTKTSATNSEQPVLDTDWIATGGVCPPIASFDEIETIANSMESQYGRVWSDSDLSRALSDNYTKKIEASGFVSFTQPEFSRSSNRNYMAQRYEFICFIDDMNS
jgi:hypothetical protein